RQPSPRALGPRPLGACAARSPARLIPPHGASRTLPPMSRQRLVVLFGGASSEHEVSIRSAASVLAAVDRARFEPIPVGITRDLQWRHGAPDTPLPTILA